jgi:hypothetical protein
MSGALLPIFPGAGFESSLLTAVLIGLLVTLLFHETLGWGFNGLVVPGYLASIFVVRPASGAIVVVEALLVYAVARGGLALLARTARIGPTLGRDRFFVLLLLSVVMRLVIEAWAIPVLARSALGAELGLGDGSGLYAVGLVIVPLAASVLYTPGFGRGSLQLAAGTGLTYLLLLLVLATTNLAITDFELSLEDIATSFAASPRAYIVLLTTALVAAYAVRRYGWDVGGILVPGLLAIAWLTPHKAVATLVEVLAVLLLAFPLRALGVWRGANPSRRLVSAFLLLYAGKVVVAMVVGGTHPGLGVTELFGMGYVLPALLVEKVWARQSLARVLGPTVLLSLCGVLLGVGVSLALDRLVPAPRLAAGGAAAADVPWGKEGELARAVARVTDAPPSLAAPRLSAADLAAFRTVLRAAARGRLEAARASAAHTGLVVNRLDDGRTLSIHEADSATVRRGFGTVLLDPEAKGPILELPFARHEPAVALAAATLARETSARLVLVAGIGRNAGRGHPVDDPAGPVAVARATLGRGEPVIRLRQGRHARTSGPPLPPALTRALTALGIDVPATDDAGAEISTLVLPETAWEQIAAAAAPSPPLLAEGGLEAELASWERADPAPPPALAPELARLAAAAALSAPADDDSWRFAAARAGAAGYRLWRGADASALVLTDAGLWLWGRGRAAAPPPQLVVYAPRARREPGTAALAAAWGARLDARLVVAGDDPGPELAAVDELVAEALHGPTREPPLVLVVREQPASAAVAADVVLSSGRLPLRQMTPAAAVELGARLHALGVSVASADSGEVPWPTRSSAAPAGASERGRVLVLWVGPALLARAAAAPDARAQMLANLLPTTRGDAAAWMASLPSARRAPTLAELSAWRDLALSFRNRNDPGLLRELERRSRASGAAVSLWEPEPGDAQLAVGARVGRELVAALVALDRPGAVRAASAGDSSRLPEYLAGDAATLLIAPTAAGTP